MKALAAFVLPFLVLPSAAQSIVPGPNQPGRYEMQPVEGGVARLDTVTGDVSLCRVEDGALRCRPSEDDDAPTADRRSELSDDGDRGAPDADARDGERAGPGARGGEHTGADADLDKAIRRMKKLFHAFGDIARDFEDERGSERGASGPDRT